MVQNGRNSEEECDQAGTVLHCSRPHWIFRQPLSICASHQCSLCFLQSNFNKALLTPKWDEADVLSKQQEDSLIARMKMFVHLRQDLERVSNFHLGQFACSIHLRKGKKLLRTDSVWSDKIGLNSSWVVLWLSNIQACFAQKVADSKCEHDLVSWFAGS